MEKNMKKNICVCVCEPLIHGCTEEINTTL